MKKRQKKNREQGRVKRNKNRVESEIFCSFNRKYLGTYA
jgi:hypothetical protein